MDEVGRLEDVAGRLGGQPGGGQGAELVVDDREEVGGRLAVAGGGGFQEARHVGHHRPV